MSSGQKTGTTNTQVVQNAGPWAAQVPYVMQGFQGASDLYGRGSYQGSYLANQSPYTLQAQQLQAQRATDPNSLVAQARGQLGATISGKYLSADTNPYLSGAVDQALGHAASTFAGQYGGAAGSNLSNSGYQEGLARNLASTALPFYMNAYQGERQNQLNALQQAPGMDVADVGMLSNVGAQQEQRGQQEIQSAQTAFNAPWTNLANYGAAISGNFPASGTSTASSPYFTNPLANAMGLAVGGSTLYRNMFGSPSNSYGSGMDSYNGGYSNGYGANTQWMQQPAGSYDYGSAGMAGYGAYGAGATDAGFGAGAADAVPAMAAFA